MKKFLILLALFLCVFGAVGVASATDLLKNGNFESGDAFWTFVDAEIKADLSLYGMAGSYDYLYTALFGRNSGTVDLDKDIDIASDLQLFLRSRGNWLPVKAEPIEKNNKH